MATTKSRKLRRLQAKAQNELIDKFIQSYIEDPNASLKICFERFGRQRFEQMLQRYLVKYSIQFALRSTMAKCLEEK